MKMNTKSKNYKLYSKSDKLIAEFTFGDDFSAEELFVHELFRGAFDLVMAHGIRYPRAIPHSNYNIDKEEKPAMKVLSLMLMYKETAGMRISS